MQRNTDGDTPSTSHLNDFSYMASGMYATILCLLLQGCLENDILTRISSICSRTTSLFLITSTHNMFSAVIRKLSDLFYLKRIFCVLFLQP